MPTFNAQRSAFTPASFSISSIPNWCLESVGTGVFGKVVMFSWGGSETTSTSYGTRWVRPTTAGTGSRTSIQIGFSQPNYTTAAFIASSLYGTSQPIVPASGVGDLWMENWNGQGGVGAIALPLNNPWWLATGVLVGSLSCMNIAGVGASVSSYGVTWEE